MKDKNLIFTQSSTIQGSSEIIPLKELFDVKFGMQLRNRKIYKNDVLINPNPEDITEKHVQCYSGKDIKPYITMYSEVYCYADIEAKQGGCWDFKYHKANPKLLVRQIGEVPIVSIDLIGRYCLNAMFMIANKPIHKPSYLELLGILNSKYIQYYWKNNFSDKRKTFPKIKGSYLELIPIPKIYENKILKTFVNKILAAKKQNPDADTTALEKEIDRLVYELYGLTEEEIAVVEQGIA